MAGIYIDPKIAAVQRLYASAFKDQSPTVDIRDRLERHAQAIHAAFKQGDDTVVFHLGSWCPTLVGQTPEAIMAADLSLNDVFETVAREYGFESWQKVNDLRAQLNQEFETCVDLVINGDINALQEKLNANASLITQHSGYGHAATLLHYLGANGVESHRQVTPLNAAGVARCLLDAGADVNAHANMYGGGSTTLGLVLTSAHPANAGVTDPLATVLRQAGAV